MSEPVGQVRTTVPAAEGRPAMDVISASREVEQGARSMLLLAEGLFRLDVVPHGDTVQTIVRSLGPDRADLRLRAVGGETVVLSGPGEASIGPTGQFGGEIVTVAGDGGERIAAEILLGSVQSADRGVTSFTAQAQLPINPD